MAQCWTLRPPETAEDVRRFPGCGKYAADSWAIFVEGKLDVEPDDGKLNWYVNTLQGSPHMAQAAQDITKTAYTYEASSNKELLAVYNEEAKAMGKKPLKTWSKSYALLETKLSGLLGRPVQRVEKKAEAPKPEPVAEAKVVPIIEAGDKDILARPNMTTASRKDILEEVAQMTEDKIGALSTRCIKDAAVVLLSAVNVRDRGDDRVVGFSYAAILEKIHQLFPGCKTSNACLRWYMVRIRQEQEGFVSQKAALPTRFKRPKSKSKIAE